MLRNTVEKSSNSFVQSDKVMDQFWMKEFIHTVLINVRKECMQRSMEIGNKE